MMNLSKKLAQAAVAAVFCLSLAQVVPAEATSINPRFEVTSTMWYNRISPEEFAFSNSNGCLLVVERTGQGMVNTYFDFHFDRGGRDYETMSQAWQSFTGSKDTVQNAAYLQHAMKEMESAYTEEVAGHCRMQLMDVADGVGKEPSHYDKFKVYNLVDDKSLLALEATVNNKKGIDAKIFGGPRWIKGTEVRVRAEANTNCQVLGYFEDREEIEVLGYVKSVRTVADPGDWAYVQRPDGSRGFVAAQFVTDNGDVVEDFQEYLKHHIATSGKYASWKNKGYKLNITDSYSGEGPRARSTMIIEVSDANGHVLGNFHVCSDGRIMKLVNGELVKDNS